MQLILVLLHTYTLMWLSANFILSPTLMDTWLRSCLLTRQSTATLLKHTQRGGLFIVKQLRLLSQL